MKDDYIVFGAPQIEEEDIAEVVDTLRSGWLGTGPKVAQFESDFAAYTGAPHAVAVGSCTAALHLAIIAAGLGAGDEVITTPLTFCATINAIIHAGATPVLADVDPVTQNIDPNQIEAKITARTRAILPVHFAGRPCDMDAICDIAERHDLIVIEDCAHAIEAEYNGRKVGTFGQFGCYSFYVTKNLATGEGGMVTTSDPEAAARIKVLALHGMSKDAWKRFSDEGYKHYQVIECGFKYNMMDIQAALGIHQLARIEKNWLRRREIWETYGEAFADLPLGLPAPVAAGTRHAYHLFTVLVDERRCGWTRDGLISELHRRNVGSGVHYLSVAEHPYYQERLGWSPDDSPNATRIGRQTVSLPLSAKLRGTEMESIVWSLSDSLTL